MSAPLPLVNVCDIYRPAGAGVPVHVAVPCRIVPCLSRGRAGQAGPTQLMWTHYLDLSADDDIRDGCTRAAGTNYVTYADGDGVRVTMYGQVWKFVVIWVEWRYPGEPEQAYTRAYLIRDTPDWL
jgi:hypothetical protein